jgi:formate dehydrogenase subunit delta
MGDDRLVHMANQIASFFASYPHDEAVAGIASHIEQFWERRMRDQFSAIIAEGGPGLISLALEAGQRLGRPAARAAPANTGGSAV